MSPAPCLPWPPDRRPLSVVVLGYSAAFVQLPPRADRADGTYLEVLADRLSGVGVPVSPHLEGKWFDFLHRANREYEARVRPHLPDVLIVQFGLNEYLPWVVPAWLIRHLQIQDQSITRTARRYRRHVARPMWRQVRELRRRLGPALATRTWQTTPDRFTGHLRRLIRNARVEARPLVLVLEITEPSGKLTHFLPGLQPAYERYQQRIERTIASFGDPEVRLVRINRLIRAAEPAAFEDGMHFSSELHAEIGAMLAEEILGWLRGRGAGSATP